MSARETTEKETGGQEPTGNGDAMSHPLIKEEYDAEAVGTATASILQVDEKGLQIWSVCSIARNRESLTTIRCTTVGKKERKLVSSLTITTETLQGDNR